jgi:hypothetical protein
MVHDGYAMGGVWVFFLVGGGYVLMVVRFPGDDVSGLFKPAPRLTLSGLPEPGGGSGSRSPAFHILSANAFPGALHVPTVDQHAGRLPIVFILLCWLASR